MYTPIRYIKCKMKNMTEIALNFTLYISCFFFFFIYFFHIDCFPLILQLRARKMI